MNEKELLEITEKIERTLYLYSPIPITTIKEIVDQLIAEVKRLTSKNKTTWEIAEEQEVDITECRNESQRLLKESQLYKDLYTKANTQNMMYKVALEEIDNLREIHMSMGCDEWEEAACFNKAEGIANKALEGETNEN